MSRQHSHRTTKKPSHSPAAAHGFESELSRSFQAEGAVFGVAERPLSRGLYLLVLLPLLFVSLDPGAQHSVTGMRLVAALLSSLIAVSIFSIQREDVRRLDQSEHDGLTGLYNRRRFHTDLLDAVKRAKQSAGALIVTYFDVDGLQRVNDARGRSVGDQVLRDLAGGLRASLQPETDNCYRVGGDELVVLTYVGGVYHQEQQSRRLHALATAQNEVLAKCGTHVTTVSSEWSPSEDASTLLDRLDAAMIAEKRAGHG
jgi:diguanylate cyclase (GGDEF)-like protein